MIKILDFYADWCGQCKALAPILDEIEKETGVHVTKVNAEKDLTLCESYGIINLPTVVILKDNQEIDRVSGLVTKKIIVDKINKLLL